MNDSDIRSESAADNSDLRKELQGLRNTLTLVLLFVFIFSFSVNVYLFRQASVIGNQVAEGQQAMSSFENGGAQQIIEFWAKLNDYAKTHPDFAPVVQKYSQYINIRTNANAAVKK